METIPADPTIRHFKDADDYRKHFIIQEQIDKYLPNGKHFIDDAVITAALDKAKAHPNDTARVRDILQKSLAIQTLEPDEMATLLEVTDPDLLKEMEETALTVKKKVYDNRIVVFAPLYVSNPCVNGCVYCGFRNGNGEQKRRILTMDEVKEEIDVLAGKIGHKRLIAVDGDHPLTSTDYLAESIRTISSRICKAPKSGAPVGIRRVNVNAAPLPVEDLRVLRKVGIGTFQVFQETYHRPTYERLHPAWSVKGNYDWRTTCFHRCMEAGVDDVGLGVLFGLYDWKYEMLALLLHSRDLEKWFNIGPHTISFPRLEPASGTDVPTQSPYLIDDEIFRRIIIVTRLSVPYTGMIVTARERPESRNACLNAGMTQLDASPNIAIKGYSDFEKVSDQVKERQQFMLSDTRSLEEVICYMADHDTITSFCTAGYRCGRTGGCIMDALKTGKEGKFCKVNAILTFREWLDDFASDDTVARCMPLLEKELAGVQSWLPKFYPTVKEHYDRICNGERDLFF